MLLPFCEIIACLVEQLSVLQSQFSHIDLDWEDLLFFISIKGAPHTHIRMLSNGKVYSRYGCRKGQNSQNVASVMCYSAVLKHHFSDVSVHFWTQNVSTYTVRRILVYDKLYFGILTLR